MLFSKVVVVAGFVVVPVAVVQMLVLEVAREQVSVLEDRARVWGLEMAADHLDLVMAKLEYFSQASSFVQAVQAVVPAVQHWLHSKSH